MPNKMLSTAEVSRRLKGKGLRLTSAYKGIWHKYRLRCLKCEQSWIVKDLSSLNQKCGCPHCAEIGHPRLTAGEVARRLKSRSLKLLDAFEGVFGKRYWFKCLACRHKWQTSASSVITEGSGCPNCFNLGRRLASSEIRRRLKKVDPSFKFRSYQPSTGRLKLECGKCGYTWHALMGNLESGHSSCRKCVPWASREASVRRLIERITGWKFPKTKPEFLRGRNGFKLELDGYNAKHKVGFEDQDRSHYKKCQFGTETHDLEETKRHDERKRFLCRYYGVTLIRIPYWKKNKEAFIRQKLRKAGFNF